MSYLPWSPRTWRATANAALDLPYGLIVGIVLYTGLSVGVSLLVLGVGIFVLAGTLLVASFFGSLFRAKLDGVLAAEVPARPNSERPGRGLWRGTFDVLASAGRWKDLLHGLLMTLLGPVWFMLVTISWSLAFGLVGYPVYAGWIPEDSLVSNADWAMDVDARGLLVRVLGGLLGIAMLFVAAWVAGLTARADLALAGALLGLQEADVLREQVTTLRTTRAAVVDAADAERRRIERDLHDGVQPQLVSLAMNLGLAQRKFDDDPRAARALVDRAAEEAKHAISELRGVIRGVHPAVLSERGLDPALSAIAARSPVPVTVVSAPELSDRRLNPTVEAVAYFVVAEALTNVARHADATHATVRVSLPTSELLRVEIVDDGTGGARAVSGSGLSGLADRAAAVDGTLIVESPASGGTTVTLEVPCGW